MLAPGAKGWIAKYFQLIETGLISLEIQQPDNWDNNRFDHILLVRSGIVFGFPSHLLFSESINRQHWTRNEHLTVLLFEAHLFTYLRFKEYKNINYKEFIDFLYTFYKGHKIQSLSALIGYFFKESREEKIERILENRTEVPLSLLHTKSWLGYLNNVFVYLDVISFSDFLTKQNDEDSVQTHDYQSLAMLALAIISLAAASDGKVEGNEKSVFEAFLSSAQLDSDEREIARLRLKNGTSFNELLPDLIDNIAFKRYLLDLSTLTLMSNSSDHSASDLHFLQQLCDWLNLTSVDLEEALFVVQEFVLTHRNVVSFLQDSSSMELMVDSISKRWIKILGRNKEKLALELKQSKELIQLIKKSTTEELSKEEKEKVKTQFMDIVKSMPTLAIFLLPGGAILLPIVLRIIPTLVPSAFRDNGID